MTRSSPFSVSIWLSPRLPCRALFTWEKVRSRSESKECRPRAGYVTLICISIEAYYPSCGNNRGIKLHTAPIKWLPCGSFYYFMHKFAFKIPPLTFCILPGLGIAAVDIWEDQKLKLFIRSQTPSSVFPHRRSEIIPSLPRTLFASPWIKCINISSSLTGWLRHLIIIETLWTEADKRDNVIKYLASLGYQISVRVSAVTGYYQCLHVYLFTHIPVHSPFSWYRSYLLTWHPLSSPLSRFNYPGAGGQAGSSGGIMLLCAVCTPSPLLHPLLSEYR